MSSTADWARSNPSLPVADVAADLLDGLTQHRRAVLVAPPGAGKTTFIPLYLLDNLSSLGERKILLLEPRRLAARAAAQRMAEMCGEPVGQTVGYRMRLDNKVSPTTRIEVVTEGILQRMILDDPELSDIGAIIFDEFHERSLDADFGLALALDSANALRDDLILLVMSATLDGARVAELLGKDTPVIESQGRMFPVDIRYRPRRADERLEDAMTAAILAALAQEEGSILAFLPGQGEIRRVTQRLDGRLPQGVTLAPLFGAMELADQRRAIAPAPHGTRKVVLATAIAETSITIDGVRIVIDSGQSRVPRFEPALGITRLETERVSQAASAQRAGRAGRTAPGIAIRLWAQAATSSLPAFAAPEILQSDLSRLILDAAGFGVTDLSALAFLDPPPPAACAQARGLLQRLGAMDDSGRLTARGKTMGAMPLGVREAAMVTAAPNRNQATTRAMMALLMAERGLGPDSVDLAMRLTALQRDNSPRAKSMRALATRLAQTVPDGGGNDDGASVGAMLIDGFSDRIAKTRTKGSGSFLMANGRAASLDPTDSLSSHDWIVVADLTGSAASARITAAASLDIAEIERHCAIEITAQTDVTFDKNTASLRAVARRKLGAIALSQGPAPVPLGGLATQALINAINNYGAALLPWNKELRALQARLSWLHAKLGTPWPAMDDDILAQTAEHWLAPFLVGQTSFQSMGAHVLRDALLSRVGYDLAAQIDQLAPTHFVVPTGNRIALSYDPAQPAPVLAVRAQELFGLNRHPAVGGGKIALIVELLSPAHRPIQRTTDLPAFWQGSWADVRADMRGRYPRHEWPQDPANAPPTSRAKPRK